MDKTTHKKSSTKKVAPKTKSNSINQLSRIQSNTDLELGQLSVDVYDNPGELIIIAPIAGVKLSDINISLTEDVLTIEGSRKLEEENQEENYLIQECFWGKFSRSIVLPDHIDSANITAGFKDGILKIIIPKNETNSKTKLIRIKSS